MASASAVYLIHSQGDALSTIADEEEEVSSDEQVFFFDMA
jgi:hypothetical protein